MSDVSEYSPILVGGLVRIRVQLKWENGKDYPWIATPRTLNWDFRILVSRSVAAFMFRCLWTPVITDARWCAVVVVIKKGVQISYYYKATSLNFTSRKSNLLRSNLIWKYSTIYYDPKPSTGIPCFNENMYFITLDEGPKSLFEIHEFFMLLRVHGTTTGVVSPCMNH